MTVLFHLSSISNASLSHYPNNTNAHFIHVLPKHIKFDLNKVYSVCVRSLAVHLRFKTTDQFKNCGFIKVHLAEIDSQTSFKSGDGQCIARVPFPNVKTKSQLELPYWYEFDTPIHIPLASLTELNQLTFTLTDAHNSVLDLHDGSPTIINIALEETMSTDQFTIAANHYYNNDKYTSNTDNDFQMHFPNSIQLDHEWECALHSVAVPKGIGFDCRYYILRQVESRVSSIEITFDAKKSSKQIFDLVKTKMQKKWKIRLEKISDKVLVTRAANPNLPDEYLFFNETLAKKLGIILSDADKRRKGFILSLTKQVGVIEMEDEELTKQLVENQRNHVAVYCDMVSDSIFGNALAPLLEILPAEECGLSSVYTNSFYVLPHLTFRPLKKMKFSSMRIQIHLMDGTPVPFENFGNNTGMTLTFLFRKRKQ